MLVMPDADLDLAADSAINAGFGSAGERCMLSVVRAGSYEDAVKLVNSGSFGNGAAVFTNDGGTARRFQRDAQAGMVGVNVPIPVPVATFSFGGWKESLFGDTKAHGAEGVRFFTQEKVVTSRWPDPHHGGINLGFPQNN